MIEHASALPHVSPALRILPEIVLTLTGVAILLLESVMPENGSRKPLGWLAAVGAALALAASVWQLRLPPGAAFFGEVVTGPFSVFFHVLITGIVLVTILVALDSFEKTTEHAGEFFALVILGAVGMCLMTSAAELLLVFISLEISSISTYILAAYRKHSPRSAEAGLKYFLLGSFATAFFLYGIALAFGATGTTNIAEIASRLGGAIPGLGYFAVAMILVGLGFKVSAAPFHVWTPDVYEGAPSPIVGLMSTAPKAAAFAVLLRIAFDAFPSLHAQWSLILWILAAISMTLGNLAALRQRNVKRMLAYSSIAHAGYLLVAFTALSSDGIAAAIFYTAAYSVTNLGIFAVISHAGGYEERLFSIADYCGLGYRSPILGGAMALFLVSLTGIPFTAGFFGKFYVFAAAFGSKVIWLTILGLVNSGIASFYYLRLVAAVYSKPENPHEMNKVGRPKPAMLIALLITASATLILGIFPGKTVSYAQRGAAILKEIQAPLSKPAANRGAPVAPIKH